MIAVSLALRIVFARETALGSLCHLNRELVSRLRQTWEARMEDHRLRLRLVDGVVVET